MLYAIVFILGLIVGLLWNPIMYLARNKDWRPNSNRRGDQ